MHFSNYILSKNMQFLWAVGMSESAVHTLREYFDHREKVPFLLHEQLLSLLREYLIVGGMPEVVNTFLKTNNYQESSAT